MREAPEASLSAGTAPATILLEAAWIGLLAGFLDLGHVGLLIFKHRLIDGKKLLRLSARDARATRSAAKATSPL